MKSAFILVISSFFLIGAFGESVSVSVMEGDSVTLHTDLTEILRTDTVEWRFNGGRIAKISWNSNGAISVQVTDEAFRDRLQLNKQTGDLKITAFSNTDSGQYTLKIRSTRGSPEKTFNVNGVNADPVKKVLGTVGESVTLKTEKQSDEVMKWRFGPQNTLIAELKVSADRFTVYNDVLDGRFRGRLELDDQTGSLNITDITTEHDGVYEAEIRGSGHTILKTFSVTVTDVKSMLVKEGEYVLLHTGLIQIQRNDVILWRFGDQGIIARLNGPDVYQTWSNVYLNDQTGDVNISNIRRDQFGDYKVEINTISMISHRKYNISETVDLVLVMEGDSVTLHTGVTKIQRDDAVLWFGDKGARITPLTGPVYLRWSNTEQNNQTGDLTIRNIRRDQSGDYNVNFSNSSSMNVHRKFHLNISGVLNADKDPVKKVLGTVGESVTLKTEKQSDEVMKWRFGPQNTVIAELKVPADSFTVYDDVLDGRFRDRLELDDQTGSLTIINTRTEHDGVYEAEIRGSGYTILKTFSVTVTETVTLLLVMEGDSVTLPTGVTKIERDNTVQWYWDKNIFITPSPGSVDARWKNTDQNDQTGDLTIKNIRRDQSGDYKVIFMNINGESKHRKFHINITDSGLSTGAIAGIAVAVVLLVFVVAGVIYRYCRCSTPERHREVNGQNHTSNRDEETELNRPAEAAE